MSQRGLTIGRPTELVVRGTDLSAESQLITDLPITSQSVLPGATSSAVTFNVMVSPEAQPGIYRLRIADDQGISNAIAVGVDRLPQRAFAEITDSLPVALHGNLAGAQILKTRFNGMSGQRVVVDVESRRLGAKLNPILRLLDNKGKQLAWSPGKSRLDGDARLEAILPTDGEYTVELHDALYRGAQPGFFRLKIGDLQFVDLVFPLGVERGATTELTALSPSLGEDRRIEFATAADDFRARQPSPLPAASNLTGARPIVIVSDSPELVELAEAEQPQPLAMAPVAVNGILSAAGEEDVFRLPVTAGQKLRIDVLAERAGSPMDGVLVIRGEKGNQLARNDDQSGTPDPGLEFQPPNGTDHVLIAVTDLVKRGGPEYVYRIAVRPVGRPDFSLAVDNDRLDVSANSTNVLPLKIERRGYAGPIHIDALNLPDGVEIEGIEIPAGATRGLLTFSASSDATGASLLHLMGNSQQIEPPIVRMIRTPIEQAARHQPWFGDELGFAVGKPGGVAVSLPEPPGETMLLGERYAVKLHFNRATDATGKIRLRLLTTQVTPKKTIKENNKDKQVDDIDRTLRIDEAPPFGPETTETTVNVLVPADLPQNDWGMVLQAELLSADEKTAVDSSTTRVFYRRPKHPFQVELTSAKSVEALAGGGETGKLIGKITRVEGYTKPLTVTLEGLPEGYPAPSVDVGADQFDFELPVRFPVGTKPADLKNVSLAVRAKCDFSTENQFVRSNPIALELVRVVAGKAPPAPKVKGDD